MNCTTKLSKTWIWRLWCLKCTTQSHNVLQMSRPFCCYTPSKDYDDVLFVAKRNKFNNLLVFFFFFFLMQIHWVMICLSAQILISQTECRLEALMAPPNRKSRHAHTFTQKINKHTVGNNYKSLHRLTDFNIWWRLPSNARSDTHKKKRSPAAGRKVNSA